MLFSKVNQNESQPESESHPQTHSHSQYSLLLELQLKRTESRPIAATVDIFLGSVAQPDCHCTSLKVSGSINSRANVGRKFIAAFDFN